MVLWLGLLQIKTFKIMDDILWILQCFIQYKISIQRNSMELNYLTSVNNTDYRTSGKSSHLGDDEGMKGS